VKRCRCRLIALTAAAVVAGCVASAPPREFAPGTLRLLPAEPAASILYVALGDSTVEGVGASAPPRHYVGRLHERLLAVYPQARLINLGVGGATAAGVLRRQLPRALELQPDLVTLSVGPNDITQGRDLESYARDVEAILRTLTHRTTAVVVVNLIPDLTVTPRFRGKEIEALVRQRVVAFNEILIRQARANGAEVVDLYAASQREVPGRPELIGADRYHPSDEGYARWAELMWAGIEARILRPPSVPTRP
jgi:lysophospholipase L1-like esterase